MPALSDGYVRGVNITAESWNSPDNDDAVVRVQRSHHACMMDFRNLAKRDATRDIRRSIAAL